MSEKTKEQIGQELIKVILKLDEYRGDINRCHEEIADYEGLIYKAENEKDGLIRDWYKAIQTQVIKIRD